MMSDLEAGADKRALGLQEVDTSENQELNISNSCLFCCMISFNSGDKVDENASARAEAMAFVWSPIACIGG
jgi:hypothetical protein